MPLMPEREPSGQAFGMGEDSVYVECDPKNQIPPQATGIFLSPGADDPRGMVLFPVVFMEHVLSTGFFLSSFPARLVLLCRSLLLVTFPLFFYAVDAAC